MLGSLPGPRATRSSSSGTCRTLSLTTVVPTEMIGTPEATRRPERHGFALAVRSADRAPLTGSSVAHPLSLSTTVVLKERRRSFLDHWVERMIGSAIRYTGRRWRRASSSLWRNPERTRASSGWSTLCWDRSSWLAIAVGCRCRWPPRPVPRGRAPGSPCRAARPAATRLRGTTGRPVKAPHRSPSGPDPSGRWVPNAPAPQQAVPRDSGADPEGQRGWWSSNYLNEARTHQAVNGPGCWRPGHQQAVQIMRTRTG